MEGHKEMILTNTELAELEQSGLKQMRALTKEFLSKNNGSENVRDFLAKASADDALMLRYLRGRKFRPEHAWETLKRKAEVRFDQYPEVFSDEMPPALSYLISKGTFGVLKNRDPEGCRVMVCQGCKWDTEKFSMLEITISCVYLVERMIWDDDCINNGIVFIQNCEDMGMNHAKQYTLPAMLRLLNVLWYANPLKIKAVYYINVPYYLYFIYGMIKPFFSKKLKKRFIVTTTSKTFDAVHANVNPEILPKFIGGDIEDVSEALEDVSFYTRIRGQHNG